MFDPEYYFSEYKIKDFVKGTERLASGRYKDFADQGPKEEIITDSGITEERQMYYCISIPGEAAWAKFEYKKQAPVPAQSSPSDLYRSAKRTIDDEDDDNENVDSSNTVQDTTEKMEVEESSSSNGQGSGGKKQKSCVVKQSLSSSNGVATLNLPIPGSQAKAVIVKLYDVEEETFALNDVVEFVGIVSLNPSLATMPLEGSDDALVQFERKEMEARNPPASLVPR